ncbi:MULTISPECIES: pro-sigmaK processing inhibitor BofA family protein [Bacillaceae]|uniref:Pro-sigmaK processing inhibitor BofA family protein n=1 Tax=Metabacillus sediminis TaxID=3117746 RepID=A0ABZ2NM66_9BACI|nr:pro-sigmaK processing inhibitor BofA family protein [Bacillus sp. SJS]KZZ83213.1 transcriptional regulator [Bacillus sp. SJS]
MNPIVIFAIAGGAIVLLLMNGSFRNPIKWAGRLAAKIVAGALLLFVLNALGSGIGIHIPINAGTSAVSGLLGIPGIAALYVIKTYILV